MPPGNIPPPPLSNTPMHHLRFAVRTLRHHPGFTVPALLALALGIGATTAIFSVVDCVLLRPLPYPEAGRLIYVSTYITSDQVDLLPSTEFLNWERANHVLEQFAAVGRNGPASLISEDGSARISAARVTFNFLSTLRVVPALGRDFRPDDARTGAADVTILSYGLWQRRWGGDPSVIGRTVNIDGTSYRVVGILPKAFLYLPTLNTVEALTPLQIAPNFYWDRNEMRGWHSIGRLKPGATIQQARADFGTLFEAAKRDFPRLYANHVELRVLPYRDHLTGGVRLVLTLLLAGVGCVLLIACGNVANLLLARGAARSKEFAMRVALGASRLRLVRQLLIENLILSVLGGAAGAGIAFAAVRVIRASAAARFPRIGELTLDARVLAFALLLSLATSVIFGLLPSLSATRIDLKGSRRRGGLRNVLVAAELALSLTLLAGAGLLFQSLWRLQHKNLGFAPESLVVADVSLRGSRFAQNPTAAFVPDLESRLMQIPGTSAVAFADGLPPDGGCCATIFVREGVPIVPGRTRDDLIVVRDVTPAYFQTVGIPLKRGRYLTAADRDSLVINEAMARHFFPGEDPIGIRIGRPFRTIVGIVADVKNDGLHSPVRPEMCVPLATLPMSATNSSLQVLVRSAADTSLLAPTLLRQLREMDPRMLSSVHTMRERFAEQTTQPRFQSDMFGVFAAVALLLAMVGIYGVVAFSVANRTREIGIRIALGADNRRVVALVLRDTGIPVFAGIAIGIAASLAVSRYLAALLYDIKPNDPLTYAVVAALLAAVAVASSLAPARRACRVDPVQVLRAE